MNVIVVGGGIMGMSVATELASNGVSVTVLEKSVPGAEASSAAAGMLAPQLEAHGTGPMLDLCLKSRELYPAWVRRIQQLSGVEVGYHESGALEVAVTGVEVERLERAAKWQRDAGLNCELLDGAEAKRREPGLGSVKGALLLPDDHQVDPPKLMAALPIAAARAGAKFRTGHVNGLVEEHGRVTGVDLGAERLHADAVVVAAGAWSCLLPGARIDPAVLQPMRGQMLELRTRLPVLEHIVVGAGAYLVPRADGRVIAGSTMERTGFDKRVTAAGLSAILAGVNAVCPELGSAEVSSVWAGLRPWTEDNLPILGPGPLPGLMLATGHFRNGILLAPVTALVISQALLGQAPEVDMTPFRYGRFPI